jgi:hypothetical protein
MSRGGGLLLWLAAILMVGIEDRLKHHALPEGK